MLVFTAFQTGAIIEVMFRFDGIVIFRSLTL